MNSLTTSNSFDAAAENLRQSPFIGHMLIDGKLVESSDGQWLESINPATEDYIGKVPCATSEDVERAIRCARKAQPAWAELPVQERSEYVLKFADAVAAHKDQLLTLEVADSGNSITGMSGDVAASIERLRYFAGLAYELQGRTIPGSLDKLQLTLREPYGVVGRIAAFNHPIVMAINGIAAPLVAGNAVVVKPSEQCSLSAALLGRIAQDVIPAGILNIVTGSAVTGDALVRHPSVKRLSFVGSARTGMAIQRSAAEVAVKSISLELGGKNPFIVFPDAPLQAVAEAAIAGMNFTWQGQSCSSTSRLFVHEDVYDEVVERVAELASAIRPGDPFDWTTRMGAINTHAHLTRIEGFVESAKSEGARLVAGGRRPTGAQFERGYWYLPTVFADVTPQMRVAREEIFGPVLSVMRWSSVDQVIEMANSVEFGLAGAVWSGDMAVALRVARRLQSGYVWVNGVGTHARGLPFGGYKNSGIGRERGLEELLSYTEEKSVQIFL